MSMRLIHTALSDQIDRHAVENRNMTLTHFLILLALAIARGLAQTDRVELVSKGRMETSSWRYSTTANAVSIPVRLPALVLKTLRAGILVTLEYLYPVDLEMPN